MNRFHSVLIFFLAAFILAANPAVATVHCDSPVNVGKSGTDDYSSLQLALEDCNDGNTYTYNLVFKLNGYTEEGSVQIPYGYSFSSGNKLVLDGRDANGDSSSLWDSSGDRFVWSPDPLNGTGYAIFTPGYFSVVIKGVQFAANINDDWEGSNAILTLKGNVTVEDCFIWLYTPTCVSMQTQKGTAIKVIGDGSYVVKNTIIFGDYRATYGYGWFDAAARIGTYSGAIDFCNTTIYSRAVGSNPNEDPDEAHPSFSAGILRTAAFTVDVSNCYIYSYSACMSLGTGITGDYNRCSYSDLHPSQSNSAQTTPDGGAAFLDPWDGTNPDFTIKNTSSDLYDFGSTTRNYADPDINGDSRSGSIDIGADEY